jgi:two-component system, NtrC family, nitrogen regulation response regulator GlnG
MKVLLLEDDASIAIVITAALEAEGFGVTHCECIADRDRLLASERFAALVTDVMLPDGDGIETLGYVRAQHPDLPIIILSAQNTLDTAVRASDTGAFEYFPKPFDIDELARTVRQAIGAKTASGAGEEDEPVSQALPLVGRSAPMQAVYRMITRVLRNDLSVLILGESGTGKELVAEAIHQLGHRSAGPFVAVNTAAIPAELIESELFGHEKGAFTGAVARHKGKFEQASGGTLFLDEIGDMPLHAQTRLLRALQSGTVRRVGGLEDLQVDTRIIAATHRNLAPMIAAGQFREDLYYRLNVVPIDLPPLRERTEDIAPLARHFLSLAAGEGLPRHQLSNEAAALLCQMPWRGNVRELKNFIFRLALLVREEMIDADAVQPMFDAIAAVERSDENSSGDLDHAVQEWLEIERPVSGQVYQSALAAFEKPLFLAMLKRNGGNQLRTAKALGINRNTLRKRLNDLDIDPEALA